MKKTGRRKKSEKGIYRYSWQAKTAVQYMREALAIMRSVDPYDGSPEFENACRRLGRCLCECCDPDNPAEFLGWVVKEFEGKLKHSPADENYFRAWLKCAARNIVNGKRLTFPEWKKELRNNGLLTADSSKRRSMKRLGLPFSPSKKS
jgi:hypothetical protein